MLLAWGLGLAKDVECPLKPLSSQAARLHPGKVRTYEPKALNETMLPMRIKKISLFHTPSTGHYQFSAPFQSKKKMGDVRRKETHSGSKKSKQRKKTGGKLKERKLVKFN